MWRSRNNAGRLAVPSARISRTARLRRLYRRARRGEAELSEFRGLDMAGVKKLSIALTEELARDIEAAVASGDYSTASEVVRDALRYWKREREAYIQRLRELVEGLRPS